MVSHKLTKLVHRLIEQTEMGKMKWEESVNPETYQVSFPRYSVALGTARSGPANDLDFVISIRNDNGEIIERVTDVDLREDIEGAYKKLERLYETARRVAMGVDEALDTILEALPPSKAEDDVPF